MEKTNVMRVIQQKKIPFKEYYYWDTTAQNWVEIAKKMWEDENLVFKTLVTVWKSWNHYVFMIPVAKELDLKKCATVLWEKYVEMILQKQLLWLTGYVHWWCSPIWMKKHFKTIVDISALDNQSIIFSWWKVGYQVEISIEDFRKIVDATFEPITK